MTIGVRDFGLAERQGENERDGESVTVSTGSMSMLDIDKYSFNNASVTCV